MKYEDPYKYIYYWMALFVAQFILAIWKLIELIIIGVKYVF